MRPVPIPDSAVWEGGKRVVFAAPDGDLTNDEIRSVEAVVDTVELEGAPTRAISVMCALDGEDLEYLNAGGHVWVTFYGHIPVFSTTVVGPPS